EETGAISFEVYTGGAEGVEERIHAQGRAVVEGEAGAFEEALEIDLSALRGQCVAEYSGERCYGVFGRMGLEYGPGHRSVERLWVGSDGTGAGGVVVAELRLPEAVRGTEEEYVLHPS